MKWVYLYFQVLTSVGRVMRTDVRLTALGWNLKPSANRRQVTAEGCMWGQCRGIPIPLTASLPATGIITIHTILELLALTPHLYVKVSIYQVMILTSVSFSITSHSYITPFIRSFQVKQILHQLVTSTMTHHLYIIQMIIFIT